MVPASILAAIFRSLRSLVAQSADSFAGIGGAVMRGVTAACAMPTAVFAGAISTRDVGRRTRATVPRIDGCGCGGIDGRFRVGRAGAAGRTGVGGGNGIDGRARIAAGLVRLVLVRVGQVFRN